MKTEEKDIYQLEVERLQAIPDDIFLYEISAAWRYGDEHSCLFDDIGEETEFNKDPCGCLTQIRSSYKGDSSPRVAIINGITDIELTEEIQKDTRIPSSRNRITKESLPVFAEWQRKIKKIEGDRKKIVEITN